MAMHWDHVLDFFHLRLGRPGPLWGSVKYPLLKSVPVPAHGPLKTSWHETYEGEAIGYEAGWAGVVQNPKK
jgi:hypothetical protein